MHAAVEALRLTRSAATLHALRQPLFPYELRYRDRHLRRDLWPGDDEPVFLLSQYPRPETSTCGGHPSDRPNADPQQLSCRVAPSIPLAPKGLLRARGEGH